jgi:hypothetical protein
MAIAVETDWMMKVEAFAGASSKARVEHLRSLTMESAARELESILETGPEFWRAAEDSGVPMLPNPLPGPSLAILLGSDPPRE